MIYYLLITAYSIIYLKGQHLCVVVDEGEGVPDLSRSWTQWPLTPPLTPLRCKSLFLMVIICLCLVVGFKKIILFQGVHEGWLLIQPAPLYCKFSSYNGSSPQYSSHFLRIVALKFINFQKKVGFIWFLWLSKLINSYIFKANAWAWWWTRAWQWCSKEAEHHRPWLT